jgi:hypothetical protein
MEAKRAELPRLEPRSLQARTTVWAVLSSTWTLGALVFLATWGGGAVAPVPGLDPGLHAGLNVGVYQGLDHGRDLIFSYGPLGFLKSYLVFYVWPARLATLYGLTLHLALSLSLVWAARRSFPPVVAVALALVAAVLMRGEISASGIRDDAGVVVLAFIWCVVALSDGAPSWVRRLIVYAGAPFAAIEILAKLNTGLVVLALLAVTVVVIETDRRRNVLIFATTFGASLAILWFAAGQGLDNVGGYLRGSFEIVSGYSVGARLDFMSRDYDYFVAPAVIAVAAAIAWVSTSALAIRRRATVLALLAVVLVTAFKAGFVSHENFHMATFYATILGACLAFRLPRRPAFRLVALVAIAAVAAAGFTTSVAGYPLTNPIENARNGVATLATMADTGRLETKITSSRAALAAAYDLDPATLRLLEGHSVHVDPTETSAIWAYQLDWRPLPVYQPYVAWTEDLDARNADAVASDAGPERILRQPMNPLGRYPGFDSPAAMIEMLCHFEPLRTTPSWQVLGRVADRCGEPQPIGSVTASYGDPIPVPDVGGNDVVFARAHGIQVSGLERLRTFVDRARPRRVVFDDGASYVFIPQTAADGLLMRAPRRVDFPAPYALAPDTDTLTFLLDDRPAEDPVTVDFFSMPVTPAAGAGGGTGSAATR